MEDLLERRTKRLYFWGPRAVLESPRALARQHPAMAKLSDADFEAALKVPLPFLSTLDRTCLSSSIALKVNFSESGLKLC